MGTLPLMILPVLVCVLVIICGSCQLLLMLVGLFLGRFHEMLVSRRLTLTRFDMICRKDSAKTSKGES